MADPPLFVIAADIVYYSAPHCSLSLFSRVRSCWRLLCELTFLSVGSGAEPSVFLLTDFLAVPKTGVVFCESLRVVGPPAL